MSSSGGDDCREAIDDGMLLPIHHDDSSTCLNANKLIQAVNLLSDLVTWFHIH